MIVLAAGGSSRFGKPKQLLVWEGKTLVRRAVRAALAARGPVVVIVGREHEMIAHELLGLPVTLVPNDHWEEGIGTSLHCGIKALPGCDAVVVLTCDQPLVNPEVVRQLIGTWEWEGKPIVASAYARTLGVPALFTAEFFPQLRSLPNTQGAKSITTAHLDEVAQLSFEGGAIDIDTPEDYERLTQKSFRNASDS